MLATQWQSQIIKHFNPPPNLTISQWADTYRQLSAEGSAEPGRWRTSRAEYQRGIMDAANDPRIDTVIVMKSAQVGATEIINNIVGYFSKNDPAPILVIQPTLEMAQTWSKDRFAPMVRDTETLAELFNTQSRKSNNTILHKIYPGGHLTIAGANSPASLASRPVRIVLFDEVDRYPPSAGVEGDPVTLATKRSTTFWNRLLILVSTPTIKGISRIEAAFNESDQRYFYVPCPACQHSQRLFWANIVWDKNEIGEHLPETARYQCAKCNAKWTDAQRWQSVRKGKWRATAETRNIAGFHINELYSSWVKLEEIVTNFLNAKAHPDRLKVWVNTTLGEAWEDAGNTVEHGELYARRESYPADVPADGLVLVAGVDVQDDRIEGEVKAFGKGGENWGIEYFIIYGNPAEAKLWNDLDLQLQKTYLHESGIKLKISAACIDSGGHFTQEVYKFVRPRENRRIFAIKGASTPGAPLLNRGNRNNKGKVRLFTIGTDAAKVSIYARLQMDEPGAGYMHFPTTYDEQYFKQLTAEKQTTKYRNGFPYRVWIKSQGARNEALDVNVYALAALEILNPNFEKIAEALENIKTESAPVQPAKKTPKKGWVNKWKRI